MSIIETNKGLSLSLYVLENSLAADVMWKPPETQNGGVRV